MKSFGKGCGSTVLIAARYWPSSHCIPAQNFVSVSAELNRNAWHLRFAYVVIASSTFIPIAFDLVVHMKGIGQLTANRNVQNKTLFQTLNFFLHLLLLFFSLAQKIRPDACHFIVSVSTVF